MESGLELWYEHPAAEWNEALPVGNGRLGAMVFGGIAAERLSLNEDTLWAGGPYDPNNAAAKAALPEIRRLLFAGNFAESHETIERQVMAIPSAQMPYQTAGDLRIAFNQGDDDVSQYRRSLDLDRAVASVAYVQGGVRYERTIFATAVDGVLVVRLTADRRGRADCVIATKSPQNGKLEASPSGLVFRGRNASASGIDGALRFEMRIDVVAEGGIVRSADDSLRVAAADSITLMVAIATSYRRFDDVSGDPACANERALNAARRKGFDGLLADHIADYRPLFRRVTIDLGRTPAKLPTDRRLRESASLDDPQLAALYVQFARYLLISCSRPGTQPANLQGLWNDSMSPPWGSKYTININTEMNYWPAEPLNLAECVDPLEAMLHDLAATGATTARKMYGARGWVCHHNTDLWRAAAPIDGAEYGMWPCGGAWLCRNLFERYRFSGSLADLERIYPVLKGAAEFFLDTLVAEPERGRLVVCPSMSPENRHPHGASVCAGPTSDQQIVRDLFEACLHATHRLGRDSELAEELVAARDRLAPTKIGVQGQIQEWLEDWDAAAPEPQHRHISHLYGLFPGEQIDARLTPKLADAARVTLHTRGDQTTGWAMAWRINCWARLLDGERAHAILKMLLHPSRTYPNLFNAHPPFQIDGNFGGASGIIELLLQSHRGEIELLPALPAAWPNGCITGLRARGGFTVDLRWNGGALHEAIIRSAHAAPCRIRHRNRAVTIETSPERPVRLSAELEVCDSTIGNP